MIVTFAGSPPNAAMLLLTQVSAAFWAHHSAAAGGVRCGVLRGQCRMRQEPERAQSIVDRDDDDIVVLGKRRTVDEGAGAQHEAAAVDREDHRQGRRGSSGRAVDVQEETVLAPGRCERRRRPRLKACRSELAGVQQVGAHGGRGRRHPAQRADRGRGIRHAEELLHAVHCRALHRPLLSLDHRGVGGRGVAVAAAAAHQCAKRQRRYTDFPPQGRQLAHGVSGLGIDRQCPHLTCVPGVCIEAAPAHLVLQERIAFAPKCGIRAGRYRSSQSNAGLVRALAPESLRSALPGVSPNFCRNRLLRWL